MDKEIRKNIIRLVPLDKPFFVTGCLKPIMDPNQDYIVFTGIQPYAWRAYTKIICNHVTIARLQVEKHIKVDFDAFNKHYLLAVKAYTYVDKDSETRGGLMLCPDLLVPAIVPANLKHKYLCRIPQSSYLDFRQIMNGALITNDFSEGIVRPNPHTSYTARQKANNHAHKPRKRLIGQPNRPGTKRKQLLAARREARRERQLAMEMEWKPMSAE